MKHNGKSIVLPFTLDVFESSSMKRRKKQKKSAGFYQMCCRCSPACCISLGLICACIGLAIALGIFALLWKTPAKTADTSTITATPTITTATTTAITITSSTTNLVTITTITATTSISSTVTTIATTSSTTISTTNATKTTTTITTQTTTTPPTTTTPAFCATTCSNVAFVLNISVDISCNRHCDYDSITPSCDLNGSHGSSYCTTNSPAIPLAGSTPINCGTGGDCTSVGACCVYTYTSAFPSGAYLCVTCSVAG